MNHQGFLFGICMYGFGIVTSSTIIYVVSNKEKLVCQGCGEGMTNYESKPIECNNFDSKHPELIRCCGD